MSRHSVPASVKKRFDNRSVVCAPCIQPQDEQLGFSFTSRECGRCEAAIEVGVVVMQPQERRSK